MTIHRACATCWLLAIAWCAAASPCAATAAEVVAVDGQRFQSRLLSATGERLEVERTADGRRVTFESGEWLRWSHPLPPARRPRVHLRDGSRIVARQDWTGKVPIVFDEQTLTLDSGPLGEVRLPRSEVVCALIEAAEEPAVAQRLLDEARAAPVEADRVWLTGGDLLTGHVQKFDGDQVFLQLDGEPLAIPATRVAAIALGRSAEVASATDASRCLVGLADGSLLHVAGLTATADQIEFRGSSDIRWQADDLRDVVYLQAVGPEMTYLSDLEPVDFQHTPYFTGDWPLARDKSLAGHALRVGDRHYAKGLAMHSAARAVYRVPAGARQFAAEVAVDASVGRGGSVVFRVYRFDGEELTPAYESDVVRGGDAAVPVSVDLDGAAAVVLVVDYADYGDELDHANWLDARFLP